MKTKILAALKTKHASLIKDQGLGEKALLGIAAMLAITVKEETEIETVVSSDGVVEALKGVQGEIDSRVNEAVEKAKEKKKPEGGGGTETKKKSSNDDGDGDDVKSLLKKLVQQNETLSEEINTIKAEKAAASLKERITSTLKEKKVDEDYITDQLDGRSFETEEAADEFISKVESSWTKLQQKFANDKLDFGADVPPVGGGSTETDFVKNLKAAASVEDKKE